MKSWALALTCLILCSCATAPRTLHVYYGTYTPGKSGNVLIKERWIIQGSNIACDDGHVSLFDYPRRISEELRRNPAGSRDEILYHSNMYRRDFSVPSGSSEITVPRCNIVWSSGYFNEFPSFSVDVNSSALPREIVKDSERVLRDGNPGDIRDRQVVGERLEAWRIEMDEAERKGTYSSPVSMPQPVTVIQPAPVYQPAPIYPQPSIPVMPTAAPPSPPGSGTTVCTRLSNGTVVCK